MKFEYSNDVKAKNVHKHLETRNIISSSLPYLETSMI